ncbi:MoaD/ThiS family protein [Spirochaetota bacterium]
MKVTVKLFATLQTGRFDIKEMDCRENISIEELMKELEIKEGDYFITFVNNRHADYDKKLSEGDLLSVFPPIGGG